MPLAEITFSGRIRKPRAGRGILLGFKEEQDFTRQKWEENSTNKHKERGENIFEERHETHFSRKRIGQRRAENLGLENSSGRSVAALEA